jgi:hypothetical protein
MTVEVTMHRFTLHTVLTAALAAGCAGSVGYSADVSSAGYGPDLVYVGPGVQVIADYDEPIFYSDSFYWRWDGGTWYRSSSYNAGWVVYSSPPQAIVRIEQPRQYVHYRPEGWHPRQQRVQQGPIVRDHRDERRIEQPRREARPPQRQAPPQREKTRDHGRRDERDHRK